MASLRSLLAAYEGQDPSPAASASIASLEKMVALQKDALLQAERDLAAARAREGLSDTLSSQQVQDTAAAIVKMGKIRRGELAPEMPPPQRAPEPPQTDEARAALSAAILAAGRKRRGEKI
jgi:hypothetical protein